MLTDYIAICKPTRYYGCYLYFDYARIMTYFIRMLKIPLGIFAIFQRWARNKKFNLTVLPHPVFAQTSGFNYPPANHPIDVWLHACSVGETVSSIALVKYILQTHPKLKLVLTCYTATGLEYARNHAPAAVIPVFAPNESMGAITRFFAHFRPKVGAIVESDWWPLTLVVAEQRAIPLISINTTTSSKSAVRLRKFWWVTQHYLGVFSHFYTRDRDVAERLRQLGLGADKISVCGCLKINYQLDPECLAEGRRWRAKYWGDSLVVVGASTHSGEEEVILQAFADAQGKLIDQVASMRLILAPRHPERVAEVIACCLKSGYSPIILSDLAGDPEQELGSQVLIIDTIGVLAKFYAASDVAIIGGSFVPGIGGHNILEPLQAGCVTIIGPDYHSQRPLVEPLVEKDGIIISSAEDLSQYIATFAGSPVQMERQRLQGGEAYKQFPNPAQEYQAAIMQLVVA